MSTLLIAGGRKLSGRIRVDGNKNSALPLIAACLLTDAECVLTNVPCIRDVEVMAQLLVGLGAKVEGLGTPTLRIQCAEMTSDEPDVTLVGRLRGSVLLLGPLLARRGRARLGPPGGDFPTRRTITTHIQALLAMGAHEVVCEGHCLDAPAGLKGTSMYLDEASVTGTETAVLAAATAEGFTRIRNAASEPHVAELCRFLKKMGANIFGEGTSTIQVEGVPRLHGAQHQLDGDYIEAGSWGVVAAVTGGEIEIAGAKADDLEGIASVLKRMSVSCTSRDDVFSVGQSRPTAIRRITTGVWPGFPSDMVSLITVLATQAAGRTLVHDWLYELRLFALEQLSGMRADLFLCDPHRIIVAGPSKLHGRKLDTRDLRSGMALIAAALAAEGESRLGPLETVERGYAHLLERLHALGAQVSLMPDRRVT